MTITHVILREVELQAEVTRLEAERDELRAKLAALEAQPAHIYLSPGGRIYANRLFAVQNGEQMVTPLYLAAGAEENQVEQPCAGYGNHAPGDAPCNVCGFTGRKP